MKKEKPQLSISLLVSNSIDTIKKCMESLVPILKSIPSELIIVDTGGTDGSIEVAREYANLIIPFTWCYDFAKARNVGLEKSNGEWFMFLDDDEWFEDATEIITFFKSGEYKKFNSASYEIRNYTNKEGTAWNESRYNRMVKLEKRTKFISPIHEILDPTYTPEKHFTCYVHHYGYVFDNIEDKKKHAERNISLLDKVLKENRADHRLMLQLAQEYGFINDFQKSIQISEEDIEMINEAPLKIENDIIYGGWHIKNIIYTEVLKENKEGALDRAKQLLEIKWINTVTKNNITHILTRLSYELGKEEDCIEYIDAYLDTYKIIQKNENIRLKETILDQKDSYKIENYYLTLLCAFKAANKLNLQDKMKEYVLAMSKTEFYITNIEDSKLLINYIFNELKDSLRTKLIKTFLKKEEFRRILIGIIEDKKIDIPKDDIIETLADYSKEYSSFLHYKILISHRGNKEFKQELDYYFEDKKNILFLNSELLDIFKDKIDIREYIERIPLKDWKDKVNSFVRRAEYEALYKMWQICRKYQDKNIKINNLKMLTCEKMLLEANIEEVDYITIDEILKEYIISTLDFFRNIYREDIFKNELNVYLPDNCKFCDKLHEIYEDRLDELTKAKIIREAVDIYPPLASFCNIYIKKMQEEANKVTDEFLQLGEMIKESIRKYIVLGQFDNARVTLEQLERLIPNDPEISELKQMLI